MMKFKIGDLVWLNIEGKFYHSRGYVKTVKKYEQYEIEYPVVEMVDDIHLSDETIYHVVDFLPDEQWELVPGSFKVKSLL